MSMNDTFRISTINNNSSTRSVDILFRKIILGCVLFSLAIFTVFGNLLVLYAIRTEKRLRTVSNLFILSLAFADFVVGLFVMPLSAANIIAGRWPFSSFICQMWLSVDYVASTASIFNLVLLSLDRYWAVVHPLLYLRNRTRKRANHFIILVWCLSFLWAPAVIFWSHIVPEHSDIIKPTECDTSFRSNKIFKTLTALVNFYFPLFAMMVISYRIMIAIHSRSTMEFGRRISAATQKQMKQDRSFTIASLARPENQNSVKNHTTHFPSDNLDDQSISIVVNPFDDSILNKSNIPPCQSDENTETSLQTNHLDNDSLWYNESIKSPSTEKKRFSLAHLKPITILFPSLSSIKENDKHKNEDSSKRTSDNHRIKNSKSVSNNMKYSDRQSNIASIKIDHIPRKSSSASTLSDEYPQTTINNPNEQQISIPMKTIPVQTLTTPRHQENPTIISTDAHLNVPSASTTSSNKMNILTFLDYIINPSLSSSLQKELKAARQLGMLVGVFTVSWLPYFILFLVVAWCHSCVSDTVYTASIWLGYLNSTFNPLIYPLCNLHFRRAFKKILYCRHAKTKIPNLNALRDVPSIRQRR